MAIATSLPNPPFRGEEFIVVRGVLREVALLINAPAGGLGKVPGDEVIHAPQAGGRQRNRHRRTRFRGILLGGFVCLISRLFLGRTVAGFNLALNGADCRGERSVAITIIGVIFLD
ncbi:hypothetical protein NL676_039557 [Syzygium grande]|nr:hypothetical protein NL676_039557 [Syzygium grande]